MPAFTYSIEDWPAGVPPDLEHVRLLIYDNNTENPTPDLWDEEIQVMLDNYPTVNRAAYECVNLLLAKYARQADENGLGLNTSRSQRFNQLKDLQKQLKAKLNMSGMPQATLGSTAEVKTGVGRVV